MHLISTSFSTSNIPYTTREKKIMYIQFSPHILAFKQVEGKGYG